jgi:isopenicillin N synthase-like dioxygenase
MKRWSHDRFLSTPHGVRNDSGTDRSSIAFFYSPNVVLVIECLPNGTGSGDLVLDFSNAHDLHREGYAAKRVS